MQNAGFLMRWLIYNCTGGVLFAVNGPDYSNADITVQGFTIEIDTGKLRAVWNIPNKVIYKHCLQSFKQMTNHSSRHNLQTLLTMP